MKFVHWPLTVDGWAVTFGTASGGTGRSRWAGPQNAQASSRCTKCNGPPINGQCTQSTITVLLYSGPLLCGFNVPIKGSNGGINRELHGS